VTTLDAAIAKSASFLRDRLRAGTYGLSCIGSDGIPQFSNDKGHVFVAWFVTEAMTGLFDEIDRTIVLVRILSEEDDGRWGYSPPGLYHRDESRVFHVDSDDTAYAIRALQRLGVNREPRGLLPFYREPERLFATFDAPGPTSLVAQPSPRNNLLAHLDVNANIFLALKPTHFQHMIDYEMLRATQDPRGYWPSYFYPTKMFATLLALGLLNDQPQFGDVVQKALAYIVASKHADGSWGDDGDTYETALAVTALAGRPEHSSAMQRGVEHLLRAMAPDGSWKSDANVWAFSAEEGNIWRAYDVHRAYVTARCLTALRTAAGQLPV
jgi:hypothetical protein